MNSNGVTIQKIGPEQLDLARQMCSMFGLFEREAGLPEPPLPTEAHLLSLLEKKEFHAVAALRDGRVIGGLTAYELPMFQHEGTELFIYDVAVEDAHRRQGVGKALIEFVRSLCAARGIGAFYVGAISDEPDTIRFYESTGLIRQDVAWFVQEFGAVGR